MIDTINSTGILQRKSASQRITQHLACQISDKQILPSEQKRFQLIRPVELRAVRHFARIIDGLAGILVSPPSDRIEVLEREAERIDAAVAPGANGIGTM